MNVVFIHGILGFILLLSSGCHGGPMELKLLQKLFKDDENEYNSRSRPVTNDSWPIEVKLKMEIQQIVDVDETNEILSTLQWLHFEWNDPRLKWDKDEYAGLGFLNLPIDDLWKPDVILHNTVHEDIDSRHLTNAGVFNTGDIIWIPPGLFLSSCPINIEWFPFDTQICIMKFGSWTYGSQYLNLTLLSDKIDISNYHTNGEWDLVTCPGQRLDDYKQKFCEVKQLQTFTNELTDCVLEFYVLVLKYDCCPEEFIDITFTIGVRRRPGFYLLNVLIPCTFVSILTLFNFLQAPDSGEKVGLGITIMLSLSVFQLIIADMIPRTSTSVPVIGAYFCGVMCLCTISLIMTLMTLKCHHTKPEMQKMPEMMRIIICEWISWFLRMQRPGKRLTRKYLKQQWSSHRNQSRVRSFKTSPENLEEPKTSVALVAELTRSGSVALVRKEESNGIAHGEEIIYPQGDENYDDQPTTAPPFFAMAAQDLESIRYELRSILNEVKQVTKKIKDDDDSNSEVNEWQYAALVIDRLCFWICSVLFLVGTLGVFVYAPQQH